MCVTFPDLMVCISCSIVANLQEELQLLFELMQLKCNMNCFIPDLLSPLRHPDVTARPGRAVWEAPLLVEEHSELNFSQENYLANDMSEFAQKVSMNSYGRSVYMRVSYCT